MKGAELIQVVASLRKNAVSYISPGIQPRKQVRFWIERKLSGWIFDIMPLLLEMHEYYSV